MTVLDSPEIRKARGAFFTPSAICDFLSDWAIRTSEDSVFEPSCGEAAFLTSAVRRLIRLGATEPHVYGAEIHSASARRARALVRMAGGRPTITTGDFLATSATPAYDAVVGNPPFVRYQGLTGDARANALRAALAQGVVLPRLTNSWAPFVVHATGYLKPGGRLAVVVPAELLTAHFATALRRFLLNRFGRVRIVLSDEGLFPGVLTDAALLMAEGAGGTNEIEVLRVRDGAGLNAPLSTTGWTPPSGGARWVDSLVDQSVTFASRDLALRGIVEPLQSWGRVSLGAVTGRNEYFALSAMELNDRRLTASDVVRISPPGSSHLRSITFGAADFREQLAAGARCFLFRPSTSPSSAAKAYIAEGVARGVPLAYKCRIRSPWWQTPLPASPDLFLTYMNGDTARLATNPLRLHHLNSVHGVYLGHGDRGLARALAVASVNSVTLLGAELAGRTYGGGILKLEPREALNLPLPSRDVVSASRKQLLRAIPAVRRILERKSVVEAAHFVDSILFGDEISPPALDALREARSDLYQRRTTRGRSLTSRRT